MSIEDAGSTPAISTYYESKERIAFEVGLEMIEARMKNGRWEVVSEIRYGVILKKKNKETGKYYIANKNNVVVTSGRSLEETLEKLMRGFFNETGNKYSKSNFRIVRKP